MMKHLRGKLEHVVREAGQLFRSPDLVKEHVVKKGAANYATLVDFQVQDFLLNELSKIIPGCNIITEESNNNIFDLEKPTFILDPVDGTTNLMHDYRHSSVSLALVIERKPAIGIIYNPSSNEMFTGESSKGAFLNGEDIKASLTGSLKDSLIGFGTTPYDRGKAKMTFDMVEKVFLNCRDIRRTGSAALDIAYVACGRNDGFFELNLQPWDFAAGLLILKEAGGVITNWSGEELNIISPESILATNGLIHKSIMDLLN